MASGLEGLKRQWGVHAAGVIMSSDPLLDLIPIMKREQDGAIITQFDYPTCEKLGLIKMDFLGLRNLTILDDAVANVLANRGETVVLEDLPLDDPKAYELLARGDTLGVFQLDGGPMRALLRSMKPDNFEDISAVIALYRPGPMGANAHNDYADRKNNRKPVVPIHPELAEAALPRSSATPTVSSSTRSRSWRSRSTSPATRSAQADLLRRAMGKKKKSELDAQFEKFSGGMKERGLFSGRRSRRCGTSCCRSPTTPSTRRTRRPTGCCPTGPPTSRRTTRPSTWPRCSPASATTRTRWPSTWPNAGRWGSR